MTPYDKMNPCSMTADLIAPCGMNCGLCSGYIRAKKPCPGCRGKDADKPSYCVACTIAHCPELANSELKVCHACATYPCKRLKQLDKRYRSKYGMSMIENLENICKMGLDEFAANERIRWACPQCGGLICVHKVQCLGCGYVWNKVQGEAKEDNHAN